MSQYTVNWTIDVEADSAEHAARLALEILRDPASLATVFSVKGGVGEPETRVDLSEERGDD